MHPFLHRLKERKLVQWALAYLAGAWVLVQVVHLLGEQFSLPTALLRSITVVLGIGFFAALVLAWYHGEKGAQRVSLPELLMLAGILIVAGMAVAWVSGEPEREEGAGARLAGEPAWSVGAESSVAVLPFVNMSGDPEQEYFSDGVTEEILSALSQLPDIRVPARTSSFFFKGKNVPVQEIAEQLGVVAVLEGSVRKAGSRVRITAQLIDARNDRRLWSQSFDRELEDIFAIQDEISRAIVEALRLRLASGGRLEIGEPPTASVEAYELYLRGRFFANKRTEDALVRAAEYFQQAISVDPNYARAYAGLAETYVAPRMSSAPGERFRRGKEAALQALALDSTLAEAHTVMGWIKMWYDRDWSVAERHFQRAIASDPSYLWAHQWYSAYLAATGRLEEALATLRRAHQIDPLSVPTITHIGTTLFWLGRYEEAAVHHRKALELDPGFFMAHWGLSRAYLHLGRHQEALRELQHPGTDYLGFFQPALLGYAHAVARQEAEARRILADLHDRMEAGEYIAPTEFAAIHIGLGEIEPALDWLERHEADRGARILLKVDPIFDPLRAEPRFTALLRRIGLE
jgi:TolB-like protein